jgi:hypothetical protein
LFLPVIFLPVIFLSSIFLQPPAATGDGKANKLEQEQTEATEQSFFSVSSVISCSFAALPLERTLYNDFPLDVTRGHRIPGGQP